MQQLIELARRLGKQIALHERTELLKKAQLAVSQDDQAKDLIETFRKQAEKIALLEQQQKPVEVADKHQLQQLEQQLASDPNFSELSRRQADFVELMRQVRQTIDAQLGLDA